MELKDKLQDSCIPGIWEVRESNKFVINNQTVYLSVQAGNDKYCEPQISGLKLDEYSHVEVAIYKIKENGWELFVPSDFGFEGLDEYFCKELGLVGDTVPIEKVKELAEHLQKLSEGE